MIWHKHVFAAGWIIWMSSTKLFYFGSGKQEWRIVYVEYIRTNYTISEMEKLMHDLKVQIIAQLNLQDLTRKISETIRLCSWKVLASIPSML